ncbi:hypothetical protein ACHQM5_003492 [Ranunculus cassubicifolius]
MSCSSVVSKAWIVASSVGAVEALKNHQGGLSKCNSAIRSLHKHVEKNLAPVSSQLKRFSSISSTAAAKRKEERLNQSEESLRKVMFLSCWGPN